MSKHNQTIFKFNFSINKVETHANVLTSEEKNSQEAMLTQNKTGIAKIK